ncbi:MAG: folylpolyglutamate synthase/dihydrofolate synthase family protein [Gaiellaceae bacterium]
MTGADYVESLSPWPADGFGVERMLALLARLGHPEHAYPAVHVVGTNGKSTTVRMIEALLAAGGLEVGTYLSPHVRGWSERIRVGGEEADFERAVSRVRRDAEVVGATQFEVLTAAALTSFAECGVDAAVVEAGLGGRHDATNVLRTRVAVLTNVGLEHTEVLGPTREAIAREKLQVVQPGSTVVLGEAEWVKAAGEHDPAAIVVAESDNSPVAVAAAEAFLGRPVSPEPALAVRLPGRLERRGDEIRDGAHTPEAVAYIAPRLPPLGAIVASILSDKDAGGMLRLLSRHSDTLVATASGNPRALAAEEVARLARPCFARVLTEADPQAAVARAHELGSPVLVTGSLYLLADLSRREEESVPCRTLVSG